MRVVLSPFAFAGLLFAFAACSGDDGPPGNGSADASTVDPATAHELVACDTESWQVAIPGLPDGNQCERACQVYVEHTGAGCANKCAGAPACPSTLDYGGLDGCCFSDGGPITFCECE